MRAFMKKIGRVGVKCLVYLASFAAMAWILLAFVLGMHHLWQVVHAGKGLEPYLTQYGQTTPVQALLTIALFVFVIIGSGLFNLAMWMKKRFWKKHGFVSPRKKKQVHAIPD